jgi:1,4-alpha-glucan branching enzyme
MDSLFARDPYLVEYGTAIKERIEAFYKLLSFINTECSCTLDEFSRGYEKFGFTCENGKGQITTYREWAPNAKEAYLIGDFSK